MQGPSMRPTARSAFSMGEQGPGLYEAFAPTPAEQRYSLATIHRTLPGMPRINANRPGPHYGTSGGSPLVRPPQSSPSPSPTSTRSSSPSDGGSSCGLPTPRSASFAPYAAAPPQTYAYSPPVYSASRPKQRTSIWAIQDDYMFDEGLFPDAPSLLPSDLLSPISPAISHRPAVRIFYPTGRHVSSSTHLSKQPRPALVCFGEDTAPAPSPESRTLRAAHGQARSPLPKQDTYMYRGGRTNVISGGVTLGPSPKAA